MAYFLGHPLYKIYDEPSLSVVLYTVERFSSAHDSGAGVQWRYRRLHGVHPASFVLFGGRPLRLTSQEAEHAKRRPMFVGKRLDTGLIDDDDDDYWGSKKRHGPMFVGKRRNPFFVG